MGRSTLSILPPRKYKKSSNKGFFQNPLFYFGMAAFVLFGMLFASSDSLATLGENTDSTAVFFNAFFQEGGTANGELFFNQHGSLALETPDLKIVGDNFIYGVSTPNVLTTKTLGNMFGEAEVERKDVMDYVVLPGDTVASIAQQFNITTATILDANGLSKGASLKVGQSIVILPVSGVIHVVKSGDTISQIAKTYKATVADIIAFNNLSGEADIFVADILMVPGGIMPSKALPSVSQTQLADSFFINPAEGIITQGLHFFNAVDLANKCGTPIYAAAQGTVQRAVANGKWNFGMGNYVTVLHSNGVSSYYGHLSSVSVKAGDSVDVGDRVGLMGQSGEATGCHVHFQVMGAANPLAKVKVGTTLKFK